MPTEASVTMSIPFDYHLEAMNKPLLDHGNISKIIENHFSTRGLHDNLQYAYRVGYSTDVVLLNVGHSIVDGFNGKYKLTLVQLE